MGPPACSCALSLAAALLLSLAGGGLSWSNRVCLLVTAGSTITAPAVPAQNTEKISWHPLMVRMPRMDCLQPSQPCDSEPLLLAETCSEQSPLSPRMTVEMMHACRAHHLLLPKHTKHC